MAVFAASCLMCACITNAVESAMCEGAVENGTGEALVSVFIAPAGSVLRYAELLEEPLASGKARAFSASLSARYWDVYALGESGNEYALTAVFLAQDNTLVFTHDDITTGHLETAEE
ncbi:MAG: hypothetical protein Pg6C_13160 [Treponemataceae bacterium]|nr:MAG: hypothetical protein Pg6C_13160 [Treponemataceae bacterium]